MIKRFYRKLNVFFQTRIQKKILKGAGIDKIFFPISEVGVQYIQRLIEKGAIFSTTDDSLSICIRDTTFKIKTAEELLITYEVFAKEVYKLPADKDFVFIDIGFNVGITSLYASGFPNCKCILAFEPFQKTITSAAENIQIIKQRVPAFTLYPFGVGYPERKLMVNYSFDFKGSTGVNGINPVIHPHDISIEELLVKDIATALHPILDKDKFNIVKMDCEGAEYEILERMKETDLLHIPSIYFIEWHERGVKEIENTFKNQPFDIKINNGQEGNGIFYAFKKQV